MIRQDLKVHLAQKQLKADYSKNIWQEENCSRNFVCPLAGYLSVQLLKTAILLAQELIKYKKIAIFLFQFSVWTLFPRYSEGVKKVNHIYWKRLVLVSFRRYHEIMYHNSNFLFFNKFLFCLKTSCETLNLASLRRKGDEWWFPYIR